MITIHRECRESVGKRQVAAQLFNRDSEMVHICSKTGRDKTVCPCSKHLLRSVVSGSDVLKQHERLFLVVIL